MKKLEVGEYYKIIKEIKFYNHNFDTYNISINEIILCLEEKPLGSYKFLRCLTNEILWLCSMDYLFLQSFIPEQ